MKPLMPHVILSMAPTSPPGLLRGAAAGAVGAVCAFSPHGAVSAGTQATPNADQARRAAVHELSQPIYREDDLWDRIWQWLKDHLSTGSIIPGVPSWVSTAIVVVISAVIVSLLILLISRISLTRRVAAQSLSVFTDDRDAATLTQAADEAAEQADFATAVVERFRAIIRSLDERGIIDDYPGMTALEAAALTHRALGEHQITGALYEAAHLFDAVLYGRVVSTRSQDQQIRDLAEQMAKLTVPAEHRRTLVGASATTPGTPT